jgi:hypothetical protein
MLGCAARYAVHDMVAGCRCRRSNLHLSVECPDVKSCCWVCMFNIPEDTNTSAMQLMDTTALCDGPSPGCMMCDIPIPAPSSSVLAYGIQQQQQQGVAALSCCARLQGFECACNGLLIARTVDAFCCSSQSQRAAWYACLWCLAETFVESTGVVQDVLWVVREPLGQTINRTIVPRPELPSSHPTTIPPDTTPLPHYPAWSHLQSPDTLRPKWPSKPVCI